MTLVGAGGIKFRRYTATENFKKLYKKLSPDLQRLVDEKLKDILQNPFPSGLGFEKLKGWSNPDIYTINVNGNYKISLECADDEVTQDGKNLKCKMAKLRKVGTHNMIDRAP